jgi:hypothetical protein
MTYTITISNTETGFSKLSRATFETHEEAVEALARMQSDAKRYDWGNYLQFEINQAK